MLTHRNFTFTVSELSRIFDVGTSELDAVGAAVPPDLRVHRRPADPPSHGTRITYPPDRTGDTIKNTLKTVKITAIVGVPALRETLRCCVLQRSSDKSRHFGIRGQGVQADAGLRAARAVLGLDLRHASRLPARRRARRPYSLHHQWRSAPYPTCRRCSTAWASASSRADGLPKRRQCRR